MTHTTDPAEIARKLTPLRTRVLSRILMSPEPIPRYDHYRSELRARDWLLEHRLIAEVTKPPCGERRHILHGDVAAPLGREVAACLPVTS